MPGDLVAFKKVKTSKRHHKTLVSEVCYGPSPTRLSFPLSDLEATLARRGEGSEDAGENMLCKALLNCWVPAGEKGFL